MNYEQDHTGTAIAVLIVAISITLLTTLSIAVGKKAIRKEAVSRGLAEWVVNTNNLNVEFKWK